MRFLHISAGFPDFFAVSTHQRLDYVMKGIKRTQVTSLPGPSRPRLPITPVILRQIRAAWAPNPTFDRKMLWAAFTMGFFGFMRAGEFTLPSDGAYDPSCHLSVNDIAVDSHSSPSLLQVHLRSSKTDPFRRGISIYLGKTADDLCPVAAILSYLAVRPRTPGPLFLFEDGKFLTRDRLIRNLRDTLLQVGVNATHFAGHSFRIGAATTAAAKGVPDSTIKMLGRWESSAYQLYIRTPRDQLATISGTLSAP